MADRRHVDAELVGAAGVGLKLDPGGTVAGAFNDAVAAAGGKAVRLVDMHLLATCAGLLSKGQVDEAVLHLRATRSDERRVGKECVSTCRYGWWPCHIKKKQNNHN